MLSDLSLFWINSKTGILCENLLSQIFSSHFQQGQDRSLELIAKENKAQMYVWKVEVFGERKSPKETLELKINEGA